MRILLDEDVPRRLRHHLLGHEVSTVSEVGWSGLKNGVLLGLAVASGFEVLLTCDRNMQHQQNVQAVGLALVVLAVPNKKSESVLPLVPAILTVLDAVPGAGTVSVVGDWKV